MADSGVLHGAANLRSRHIALVCEFPLGGVERRYSFVLVRRCCIRHNCFASEPIQRAARCLNWWSARDRERGRGDQAQIQASYDGHMGGSSSEYMWHIQIVREEEDNTGASEYRWLERHRSACPVYEQVQFQSLENQTTSGRLRGRVRMLGQRRTGEARTPTDCPQIGLGVRLQGWPLLVCVVWPRGIRRYIRFVVAKAGGQFSLYVSNRDEED